MPGSNNKVHFSNGIRLESSAAEEWFLMQRAPNTTNVSFVNNQGSPEGVVQANMGSTCYDNLNGNMYLKHTGTGTTGWLLIATGTSIADLHTARYIVSANGTVDGANYSTIATAYAAAVAAGAPQTVFVQPGTYTENLTLTVGINISAYSCDAITPNVSIIGKLTLTTAGDVSISGIDLRTNGDFAVSVTGTAASQLNLINCRLMANDANAIQFTSSDGSSKIECWWCNGDLAATRAFFTHSGAGKLAFYNSVMENNGVSTTASTLSGSGSVQILNTFMSNAITTSSTSNILIQSCQYTGALIVGSSGASNVITNSKLIGGASSSLSVGTGATVVMSNCAISSSNTNAITGLGTIQYGNLTFISSSSLMNTTTQVPLAASNDGMTITTPGAYPYTTVPQDGLIKVDTSAARTITPLASPTTGQKHIIKDTVGSAAANNITITPSGKNIDGAASATININYGSATIVFTGVEWSII